MCTQRPADPLSSSLPLFKAYRHSWKRRHWQGSKCPMPHAFPGREVCVANTKVALQAPWRKSRQAFLCLIAPLICTGRKRHLSPCVTWQGHKQLIFNKGQNGALFDILSNRENKLGLTTRCIFKCWLPFTLQHRPVCEACGWRCCMVPPGTTLHPADCFSRD